MTDFVKWVQRRLNAYGAYPPLDVDGDFGRNTQHALRLFQFRRGLERTGIADHATVDALKVEGFDRVVSVPAEKPVPESMPVWMGELHRRMGLHEVRDNARLIDFLKIGKYLGNPKNLPWCGDGLESVFAKTLPNEPLPSNPFFAQNWVKFGVQLGGLNIRRPYIGAVGVIRWNARSGHVGIVAGVERDRIALLGGNQSNRISIAWFPRSKFIAFRWPKTAPFVSYPALVGGALQVSMSEASTR